VNGLDPEGILWVRTLLKQLASEGRTVFVSSHLMSEMEETADHVLVIGQGKLLADMGMQDFIRQSGSNRVRVVTPDSVRLLPLLQEAGATVTNEEDGSLSVFGLQAPAVGELAAANSIVLHELSPERARLEAAFMEMTRESVQYRSTDGSSSADAAGGGQ
jgi:ABC-2 type transport system ATP-binding protein